MKRKPLEVYDCMGDPIEDDEFIECRKVFRRRFDARFRRMAHRAVEQDRTMIEVIETAFIQGMAFAVMPRKSSKEPEGS